MATDPSGNHGVLYGWYGGHVAHEQLTITLKENSGLLSHVEYGEVNLTEELLETGLRQAIQSVTSLENGIPVNRTDEFEGKFSNFSFYLRTEDSGKGTLYSIQNDGVHLGKDTKTPIHLPAGTYYLYVVYVEAGEETASKHIVFDWGGDRPSFDVMPREITIELTFTGHAYGEDFADWVTGATPTRTGGRAGTWYADGENDIAILGLTYSLGTVGTPSATTSAGTYDVVAACGNANYHVTFLNAEGGELTYIIEKATVERPAEDGTRFTYTGEPQTYSVERDALYTVSGEVQANASEAGHNVTIHLLDQVNYKWDGGDSEDLVYKFVIHKAILTVTANDNAVTYGDAPADGGVTYSGFVHGEGTDVLTGRLAFDFGGYAAFGDVGEYFITPSGLSADNYAFDYEAGTLTVNAKEIEVAWGDERYTYTGSAFTRLPTATAEGIGGDGTFTLLVQLNDAEKTFKNAGDYLFRATLDGTNAKAKNYTLKPDTATHSYTVEKQTVAAPTIQSKVYNGTAQRADVAASPLYTVRGNDGGIDAGDYTVTLALADSDNYKWAGREAVELVLTFTILKATYDMSGVTFEDLTVTYDAEEHSLFIEGTLPNGVRVTYAGNGQRAVGEYTVTASFTGDARNYEEISPMAALLKIVAVSHDLSGVGFGDGTVKYDGNAHSLFIEGALPANVTVSYEGNGQTDPNIYTVTAVFSDPDGVFAQKTATLTILRVHLQTNEEKQSVAIDSEEGFDPTLELVIEKLEGVERGYWAWQKDTVSDRYIVKLCKDGEEVPIDGKVTVRLLIPEAFQDKGFELMSATRASGIEYSRDGDYVVFEADGLSSYMFVRSYTPYFPIVLAATGVLLADSLFLIVLAVVIKKKKNKRTR